MHHTYNRKFYPRVVWNRTDSPWLICADELGNCAAIPRDEASGHKASHFGNLEHVRRLKIEQARQRGYNRRIFRRNPITG